MVKTQQEVYAEKYRAGTLTGAERSTLLNAWKTLWIEETQKRLQTPQAETPVMQHPQPQVGASPVPKVYQENTVFANDQKAQPTIQPAQPTTQQPTQPIKTDTPQDITYSEDAVPFSMDKVIGRAEKFQWADKKMYQTVRNADNTLTTIDTQTGQAVTGKYTDDKRDQIKQSFLQQNEQQVPDVDTMFQSIRAGQNVPTSMQNTVQYQRASQRLANVSQYENLSANDVAYSMQQGKILPWSQTYMDLKAINPQLVAQAEQLNSINSAFSKDKKTNEDYLTTITEKILASYTGDVQSLQSILSENPQVVKLNEDMQLKALEVAEMKDAIEYNLDDIEDRLSGTGATRAEALALNSMQMKELTRAYNLKLNEYNTLAGTLERITENIKYEQEEKQQNEAKQLEALEFAYGIQTREQDYQRGLDAEKRAEESQTRQLEQNYAYQYGDLNSENPTLQNIAIERAVAGMYENYPIPWMESQATKVQKVKNLMAQGMTGTEAIAQVESEIRNSQRYKDYIASEQAKTKDIWFTSFDNNLYKTDSQGNISLAVKGKEDVKEWKKLDDGTYVDPNGDIRTKQELDQEKLLSNKFLTMQAGENAGVECWVFASRGTGMTSTPGGNSLTDRITAFKDQEPVVWGMVLFSGGNYDPKYGNISIVTGVSADGNSITIKESNLKNDKSVTERTIPITEATGFYNDTPLAGGWQETGITDKQYTQYNQAYTAFRWNPLVKNFEEALSSGGDLISSLKSENWPWDVGAIFQFMKTLDPASVVRETEFAIAQNTSGLSGKFSNLYEKVINWDRLSDEQRKAFWKIAFEYIKNKGKSYDIKYDDFTKVLKNQWIPDSYYPTRMSDYITQFENPEATQTTTPATVNYGGKTYNFKPKQ